MIWWRVMIQGHSKFKFKEDNETSKKHAPNNVLRNCVSRIYVTTHNGGAQTTNTYADGKKTPMKQANNAKYMFVYILQKRCMREA